MVTLAPATSMVIAAVLVLLGTSAVGAATTTADGTKEAAVTPCFSWR